MRTVNNNSVECALFNLVPPNKGHRPSPVVITDDLDSILVRFGDLIVKELGLVVLNLDSHSANLDFVLNYISINIERCDDG